jgi:hypothetical protein
MRTKQQRRRTQRRRSNASLFLFKSIYIFSKVYTSSLLRFIPQPSGGPAFCFALQYIRLKVQRMSRRGTLSAFQKYIHLFVPQPFPSLRAYGATKKKLRTSALSSHSSDLTVLFFKTISNDSYESSICVCFRNSWSWI